MSSRLRVLRHESELGRWELASRPPDPRLRGHVADYQGYVEHGSPPPERQQVPAPMLPVIVNFGSAWNVAATPRGPHVSRGSFVAGLGDGSSYVAAAGPAKCVQVNLSPRGARAVFRLPLHELANETVPLEDLLPRGMEHLVEQVEDAATWERRFDLLDSILVRLVADAPTPSADAAWAWTMLERTRGTASIGWICERLGRSRRHLARQFREHVGLPPKTVARILRFDHAVALLSRGQTDLTDIAFACGYYDQAHLNRDFREFAAASPGAFVRRIVPDGGVIL